MQLKYTLSGQSNEIEVPDSEDLAALCTEVEGRLRQDHPELAGQKFLSQRVADALLNGLAVDNQEIDLGDLSRIP
jgi:hypothetical protein